MGADTVLVTGVHRAELPFGDQVAALVDAQRIDVMRIPHGIDHSRGVTSDGFYFTTQHREMYLQLRQQVKGRYGLLIDLHCGINEGGHCADIFCHDRVFLNCLAQKPAITHPNAPVRLIKIVAGNDNRTSDKDQNPVAADAHTWIPRQVWGDSRCIYVGLEVYLPDEGEGSDGDWQFARRLIETIQGCNPGEQH